MVHSSPRRYYDELSMRLDRETYVTLEMHADAINSTPDRVARALLRRSCYNTTGPIPIALVTLRLRRARCRLYWCPGSRTLMMDAPHDSYRIIKALGSCPTVLDGELAATNIFRSPHHRLQFLDYDADPSFQGGGSVPHHECDTGPDGPTGGIPF